MEVSFEACFGLIKQGSALTCLHAFLTTGFLYRAGAETTPSIREKFRVSPRTVLNMFSAGDTQTAVLLCTAEVWISVPDTQTSVFLGFLGIHRCFWVPLGDKFFQIFPIAPVTKIRVSGPAPYKDPTVIFPREYHRIP